MILDNFQRKIRQEAQLWRDEGIISASQYQQLADRYQFNNLENAARERSGMMVIGIGGILLVLGVAIFVAANWLEWSREVKFILMMSLFLSTTIVGFFTWREPALRKAEGKKPQRSKRIMGEALLFLGALILGANILLMAQVFNIGGSSTELFLAWGFGVLVMAYSLSLTSLGILAIVLIQIGYWTGLGDWWYTSNEWTWAKLAVRHMPLVSWLLFVPLAYFCRSRIIFGLAVFCFVTSLQFNLNPLQLLTYSDIAPWVASFAFALPPALLWSYDDLLYPTINYRLFKPLARNLALVCFGVAFYILSFRWQWQFPDGGYFPPTTNSNILRTLPIIDVGILSGLAVLQWSNFQRYKNNSPRKEVVFKTALIIAFIAITALVPFWHQAVARVGELGIFVFNVLLATLSWGLIQEGLKLNDRRSFWGGMLLLTLQIISRVLEYDTDLLFRALVFATCGTCLISAGLWFERRQSGGSSSAAKK
ncbi:DUF2157 domain-containing protein [Fortiea contorta]|uniref:DUF2157 domain-containing protein n=1 Tax=Fortiea contorta TaxID=1892405 RepID=UPI000347439F|nr:DUF2157 domain-containing protein [Fortiea contorta]